MIISEDMSAPSFDQARLALQNLEPEQRRILYSLKNPVFLLSPSVSTDNLINCFDKKHDTETYPLGDAYRGQDFLQWCELSDISMSTQGKWQVVIAEGAILDSDLEMDCNINADSQHDNLKESGQKFMNLKEYLLLHMFYLSQGAKGFLDPLIFPAMNRYTSQFPLAYSSANSIFTLLPHKSLQDREGIVMGAMEYQDEAFRLYFHIIFPHEISQYASQITLRSVVRLDIPDA